MSSSILNTCEQQELVRRLVNGETKAGLSRAYGVSTRTIGRYYDKHVENITATSVEDVTPSHAEDSVYPCRDVEYSYLITPGMVITTEIIGENIEQVILFGDDAQDTIEEICAIIEVGDEGIMQSTLHNIFNKHHTPTSINVLSQGNVRADPKANKLWVVQQDGREISLSGRLVWRFMDAIKEHENVDHLVKFCEKLVGCHNKHVLDGLYDFLEAADIMINNDGNLVCFKKVRGDYTDVYTGTFDNSVGQYVSVLPSEVDANVDKTCSHGLHCASWAYLNSYPGERIMKVEVDPGDVIAIPRDYYENDGVSVKAKMRTCAYKVIGE